MSISPDTITLSLDERCSFNIAPSIYLVCGIWSQFFMIQLISWRIALVGFALPWLGFAFGCLFSKVCRRERKDIIAIAVETGIQNTGEIRDFLQIKHFKEMKQRGSSQTGVTALSRFTWAKNIYNLNTDAVEPQWRQGKKGNLLFTFYSNVHTLFA